MPQLSKGGKFVFGWSLINEDLSIKLPRTAIEEYDITFEKKVIIISGSMTTGGFCVSRKGLIEKSDINGLLKINPMLRNYKIKEGDFVKYKGRLYCWLSISDEGFLKINDSILNRLDLKIGDKLLSIRGSDMAFVMGVKGPLIEKANKYQGIIELYK